MRSSAFDRWSGFAAVVGGLVWTASWLLNDQTAEGNRAVLGLTEGNSRLTTGGSGPINARPLFGRSWELSLAYRF